MALCLPAELFNHIFSYSIPAPSRTAGPPRSQQLCVLSLVSKQWRAWAQGHLIQNVTLSTQEQAVKLARQFDRLTFDPLSVRSLVLDTPLVVGDGIARKSWRNLWSGGSNGSAVLEVVRRMKRVQVVWSSATADGERDLERLLDSFEDLKSIRLIHPQSRLHLNLFSFVPYSPISTITSVTFTSSTFDFFFVPLYGTQHIKHTFSNVTHLSLIYTGEGPPVPGFSFEMLAPQLVSLLISVNIVVDPAPLLQHCKRLKTLLLDTTFAAPSLSALMETLPETLVALHLVGSSARVGGIDPVRWMDFVTRWGTTTWEQRLEKLVLWSRLGEELTEEGREGLTKFFEGTSVGVVIVPRWRGALVAEDWDPDEF